MRCTARRSRFSTWRIVPTWKSRPFWKCPLAPLNSAWPVGWRNSNKSSPGATRFGTNWKANVNSQQAKQVLTFFRPGTADEKDPSFHEARRLVKTDPELARWFETQCEFYLALRGKFQAIPIPPRLKDRILSKSQQAKQILALFRPGTADEKDPSFHEALQQVKT